MASNEGRLPECLEKSRLMDEYSAAIAEFSRTAGVVNTRMGIMYKGDYERLTKIMNAARARSEELHRQLLDHVAVHSC